jgi:hypothetical protein
MRTTGTNQNSLSSSLRQASQQMAMLFSSSERFWVRDRLAHLSCRICNSHWQGDPLIGAAFSLVSLEANYITCTCFMGPRKGDRQNHPQVFSDAAE